MSTLDLQFALLVSLNHILLPTCLNFVLFGSMTNGNSDMPPAGPLVTLLHFLVIDSANIITKEEMKLQ